MSANALTTGGQSGILTLQPKKTAAGFSSPNVGGCTAPLLSLAVFLYPQSGVLLHCAGAALDGGLRPAGPTSGLLTHPVAALFD